MADDVGVLGAESLSVVGTNLDLGRTVVLLGGDVLRSMADAERAGGGPTLVPVGNVPPDR